MRLNISEIKKGTAGVWHISFIPTDLTSILDIYADGKIFKQNYKPTSTPDTFIIESTYDIDQPPIIEIIQKETSTFYLNRFNTLYNLASDQWTITWDRIENAYAYRIYIDDEWKTTIVENNQASYSYHVNNGSSCVVKIETIDRENNIMDTTYYNVNIVAWPNPPKVYIAFTDETFIIGEKL